ncbi:MAG TPA: hypothetical protein VIH42_06595 [Thermoguttaceae bacterium]|nr:hypothetical protein [Sedimentisphaerales bacterium]
MTGKVTKIILLVFVGLWPCNTNAAKYEYDPLNRLIRAVYDENTSIEYSYDSVGNRTRELVIAPPNPDLNLNGRVNFADLAELAENWLDAGDHKKGDLNLDGVVDTKDIAVIAAYWLDAGEPL